MEPVNRSGLCRERGLALVVTLWVVSVLTIMAGSFALSMQRETAVVGNADDRTKALALAEGGVHYALMMVSLADPRFRWRGDGTPYTVNLGGTPVKVAVYDEAGKLDINLAQEQTLRNFLLKLFPDPDQADRLTDAIADWRDADDLKHLHGAEARDYEAAGIVPGPQNRPFLVAEELRGVIGMTPEIYHKLLPFLSLHSGQDGINPVKASAPLLRLLAGDNPEAVDSYLALRESMLTVGAVPAFPPVAGIPFTAGGDTVFTVEARAAVGGAFAPAVRAVVKRERGKDNLPFVFLHWQTETLAEAAAGEPPSGPPMTP